jgi:hypothetical protein
LSADFDPKSRFGGLKTPFWASGRSGRILGLFPKRAAAGFWTFEARLAASDDPFEATAAPNQASNPRFSTSDHFRRRIEVVKIFFGKKVLQKYFNRFFFGRF